MPRRTSRKASPSNTGKEIRHQYVPHDFVSDESWKAVFPSVDPQVPVLLDRGTFEWLWDFVARKGRQADADNFNFSDVHKDVYQRAANQFALAAQEAFGDVYKVVEKKPTSKKGEKVPAKTSTEPSTPRKRRRRVSKTAATFEPSESLTEPSKTKRRRRRRSAAPS